MMWSNEICVNWETLKWDVTVYDKKSKEYNLQSDTIIIMI